MIRKFVHVLALGLLACYIYLPRECDHPSPFWGGVVHPFASNPQYDITEPQARQRLSVDEHINGTSNGPAGGAGLKWSWRF